VKKFNFRLAGYLRIKEFEEKNAWNEVLKQEARTSVLQNKIDNLNMRIRESREAASRAGQASGATAAETHLLAESIIAMGAQVVALQSDLEVEMKILEKLVAKHRETKKDAKVINNFKDRKKNDFEKEKAKSEEKQRHDFSTQSFIRKVNKG